jgi:hypothetical protein
MWAKSAKELFAAFVLGNGILNLIHPWEGGRLGAGFRDGTVPKRSPAVCGIRCYVLQLVSEDRRTGDACCRYLRGRREEGEHQDFSPVRDSERGLLAVASATARLRGETITCVMIR